MEVLPRSMSYLSTKKISLQVKDRPKGLSRNVGGWMSFLVILLVFSSCVEIAQPYDKIPPGLWRAELELSDEDVLPFNFEVSYDDNDELLVEIINAEERIPVSDISFGMTKDLQDTIVMSFPLMDSYITATYKENILDGTWHVNNREDYDIPFEAYFGQGHRFTTDREVPKQDLTGTWEATFELETEDEYPAIGEFEQKGNFLYGTFRTETGDYRYLQGSVQGDKFFLSAFDGGHAFLFKGEISSQDLLVGSFVSGSHYKTNWVARPNPEATLTSEYALSQITTPDKKISFSLPNQDGDIVSLDDPAYQGKAKLITIMGTWCPNCLDEAHFLIDYAENNDMGNIEIIGLAFEKYRDRAKATERIKEYKDRLGIPYDLLLAGYYDKVEATKSLGWIDEIISYPTLLFVNKENQVIEVHTGFNGPATSKYASFVDQFDELMAQLSSN